MINHENFSYYLRYLVQKTEKKPISYDEIPKEYENFFSIPGLSQALNISIHLPHFNCIEVEKYMNENKFYSYDSLINGIKKTFQKPIDKLYAAYYYITHNISYDEQRSPIGSLPAATIFERKKGVCRDYTSLMIDIAKRVGISEEDIEIFDLSNASKASGWDPINPSKNPNIDHPALLIKIDGEYFISEPTWGAVSDTKKYKKSNFLIPYYTGILRHFPEKNFLKDQYLFSYDNFTSLNYPYLEREISFESNPFQIIQVENGYYEFQFSAIQDNYKVELSLKKDDEWITDSQSFGSVSCIETNLPNHCFSFFPDIKRCRYKIILCFVNEGFYKCDLQILKVSFSDGNIIYDTTFISIIFFDVKVSYKVLPFIFGNNKYELGFIPITPLDGLTKIVKGYVRIRFAMKSSFSNLSILLYKINNNNSYISESEAIKNHCSSFTASFPFDVPTKNDDQSDKLIEQWILIKFPENGRWKVKIEYGSSFLLYFFDVSGAYTHDVNLFFDFPKTRSFSKIKIENHDEIRFEPSESLVFVNEEYFCFHVFSKSNIEISFNYENQSTDYYPNLISANKTDKQDIIDYQYSMVFNKKGMYEMKSIYGKKQKIFYGSIEFQEESFEDKLLIERFKRKMNQNIDNNSDIPLLIQKRADKMLYDAIKIKKERKMIKNELIIEEEEEEEEEEYEEEINYLIQQILLLENEINSFKNKFYEIERNDHDMRDNFIFKVDGIRKELKNKYDELLIVINQIMDEKKTIKAEKCDQNRIEIEKRIKEIETRITNIENQLTKNEI